MTPAPYRAFPRVHIDISESQSPQKLLKTPIHIREKLPESESGETGRLPYVYGGLPTPLPPYHVGVKKDGACSISTPNPFVPPDKQPP